jgi:hypothetical protein
MPISHSVENRKETDMRLEKPIKLTGTNCQPTFSFLVNILRSFFIPFNPIYSSFYQRVRYFSNGFFKFIG